MSKLHVSVLAFSVVVLSPVSAYAQDCRDGLVRDTASYRLNRAASLAFLRFATTEHMSRRGDSLGAGLGLGDINLNLNSNSSRADVNRTLQQENYSYSETESIDYFVSSVPLQARLAYFDCVNNGRELYLRLGDVTRVPAPGQSRVSIELVRRAGALTTTREERLTWTSSDAGLASWLNRNRSTIGPAPSTISADAPSFNPAEGLLVRVSVGNRLTTALNIPPDPPLVSSNLPPWSRDRYDIPIRVALHQPGAPNRRFTVNVNPNRARDSDTNNTLITGRVPGGNIQEIRIDFDERARVAQDLPFQLSPGDLTLEYWCRARGGGLRRGLSRRFPQGDGWLSQGQRCGDERSDDLGGEPVIYELALRLTGRLSTDFSLIYACNVQGAWQRPRTGEPCVAPPNSDGIGPIEIEVDSIRRTN